MLRLAGFSLAVFLALPGAAMAQSKSKAPVGAEQFAIYKDFAASIVLKAGQTETLNTMKAGNVNLDPPSASDKQLLEEMAKYYIYPITQPETYFAITKEDVDLPIKSFEAPSLTKVFNGLKSQLVIVAPGSNLPATQVAYAREFGVACTKAIKDIFAKGPPPIVRINALRVLALVAETGAPAPWPLIAEQLAKKNEKDPPLDVLFYGLRAAEGALASYDADRGLKDKNWVQKKAYFDLVSLVDEFGNNPPDAIVSKTFLSESSTTATLTTNPKAPKAALTIEQRASVQAFRLNAIRALAKVKTDVIRIDGAKPGDPERVVRPLFTLARFCVTDNSLIAPPSAREIGESLLGIANMTLSETVDPLIFAAVITRGTIDFGVQKSKEQNQTGEKAVSSLPWKVYGTKLEASFAVWEKEVQSFRTKLPKEGKELIVATVQQATRDYFAPMAKTDGKIVTETMQSLWEKRVTEIGAAKTPPALFTDQPKLQFNAAGK